MGVGSSNRGGERHQKKSAPAHRAASNGRKPPADRFSRTIPSDHAASADLQDQLLESVVKAGFRGSEFFAIKLALEEAMVNAIKHGNRLDSTKQVHVEAQIAPRRAEFTIEDQGPGFERSQVPDPCADENLHKSSGRGILLIEAYMTHVTWDRGGRRLRMVKESREPAEELPSPP